MPEKIVIPFAVADYTAQFRRPVVRLLADKVGIVQAIVDAWEPWGFQLNDMELRTQGKLTEQGVNFPLPDKGASFFISAAECRFHKDTANWGEIEETLEILDAARNAVLSSVEAEISKQTVVAALHFQPTTKTNNAILGSLLSPTLTQLNDGKEPTAYAAILGWENKHLLLDTSAGYANGIFMRLSMTFEGTITLEQLAQRLFDEELRVFKMLDVGEEANV